MIRIRTFAKISALTAALCVHGALAYAVMTKPSSTELEGQTGGVEAQLGSSFADLSAGALASAPPSSEPLQPAEPSETIAPVKTHSATTASSTTPLSARTVPTLEPVVPSQTLAAQPDPIPEDLKKQKPIPRPKRVDPPKPKATAAPPQRQKPAPASSSGNAKQTARAGQTDGKARASSVTSGAAGKSKEAGNAAVSNYPGKVMRKISRVKRPRVSSKGIAVVRFSVSQSGALSGLAIARSSGSNELDAAALRVVQKAAPFPKPPQGAQTSFSVQIKGR